MINARPSRKALAQSRARSAVCWGLILFVGLQLGFYFPLSALRPELLDMEYGRKLPLLRAGLQTKNPEQPFVLALGSSMTGMALRPEALAAQDHNSSKAFIFNYGINNGLIFEQLLILRRLRADRIRPDLVMVEIYPAHNLCAKDHDPEHFAYDPHMELQYQDFSMLSRYHVKSHRVQYKWLRKRMIPCYHHRFRLQNWLAPAWTPASARLLQDLWLHTDKWGWETSPHLEEAVKDIYRTPEQLKTIRDLTAPWNHYQISPKHDTALREVLELCRRDKIDVLIVWPPESSYYRQGYAEAGITHRIESWFDSLRRDTGVRIVIARDWLGDDDFSEGFHATPYGASIYTRRLYREAIAPRLAEKARLANRVAK